VSGTAILLSGGIDSTAVAFWHRPDLALTINYGQASARGEIRAATQIAKELKIAHAVIQVDCSTLGSGDLAGKPAVENAPAPEWWPFRNQLLVTLAAMKMVPIGLTKILLGSVKSDSFHVDGTDDFFHQIDRVIGMQEGHLRVETPAIAMTTIELIRSSKVTDSILGWTHSCHKADFACGSCRGCWKRENVLDELGW
jgi:7-cyano-7-deazaguanine synthase